jgi:hypothetical protein
MTVAELIAKLSELPQDLPVRIIRWGEDDHWYDDIDNIKETDDYVRWADPPVKIVGLS